MSPTVLYIRASYNAGRALTKPVSTHSCEEQV